jgi:Protein of unknown function (DUF1592)/Protein of unknown function (DUF1588)
MDERQARIRLDDIVAVLNRNPAQVLGAEPVRRFVEQVYIPQKYENGDWRRATGQEAEYLFRRSILPEIGGLRCRDLKAEHLRTLLRKLAGKDLSYESVSKVKFAVKDMVKKMDFIFRSEVATPSADGKGGSLDSYSRATRLSFLMWNSTPDAELLRAAGSGELNTSEGQAKQVDRLMASPRLDAGMSAFFDDMLQLDTFDTVSKDSLLYPKWGSGMATSAREETLRTVIGLALHDNGDIRDLMTTRQNYIDRRLAVLYRVPFPFTGDWVKYEFPADSGRSGILTQISMLSMFSHPGRSSPTKRGVALLNIFLCSPTPEPPNDVDFSVVNDPNSPLKTLRERLMAHATNKVCASCHTRSDPIGLSLEGFDTIGGYRTTENGVPIDVSATIQGSSFPAPRGWASIYTTIRSTPPALREDSIPTAAASEVGVSTISRMPTRRSRIPVFAYVRCSKAWY